MTKKRILIVEDELIVAEDIKRCLEKIGYAVAAILPSGEEVLKTVEELRPDLVLMDIILQGEMNGISTVTQLGKKYPVVYLTAHADAETLARAKKTEPYGYIIKPFDERELQSAIEIALYKFGIEKKLREREAWLSTTMRSIGDAVITTDPRGAVEFMNKIAEQLTGWREEEAIGRPLKDVFKIANEDTKQTVEDPVDKVIRLGRVVGMANHTILLNKDGREVPIDDSAAPIRDEQGNIMGIVLVFSDITSRKEAELALAKEKELLAVTLRSIGDGVITTDVHGNIILLNKVAEELTGWNHEEAVGRPLNNVFYIINEKTRKVCEDPVKKVLESGHIIGLANHTCLIDKNGNEKSIADSAAPIRDKDSKIIGTVLVFRDVTLENKITAELAKTKKLESIGVLAGGIAHDFNNILTGIMGNIVLGKLEIGREHNAYGFLDAAEKASERANKLTKQLLTFSKGGEPVREVALIYEIIKESADFILTGSNISCRIDRATDLWAAAIDKGQISQVVQNIILNAKQAMPGGGTIHILCENYLKNKNNGDEVPLQEGDYIKITINDEGAGIAEEQVSNIFDPYFSTKQAGSGLGLAVTHSIIKKHFGHISCESKMGRGASFIIYLPATSELVAKRTADTEIPTGRGRILIMDDDKVVRDISEKMLRGGGYEVIHAKDGMEAIDLYSKAMNTSEPVDLVIMDLTIPGGMGGREATQKLLEIAPDAKTIVASGYSNDPVMANYKEYGFLGVLEKPLRMKKLLQTVADVLSQTREDIQ